MLLTCAAWLFLAESQQQGSAQSPVVGSTPRIGELIVFEGHITALPDHEVSVEDEAVNRLRPFVDRWLKLTLSGCMLDF